MRFLVSGFQGIAAVVMMGFVLMAFSPARSQAEPAASRSAFSVEVTGEGPPMILIPGLNSSGEVWKTTVEHFRGRYQCHVLTLAGFGGTPALEEGPFLERVLRDLERYIAERDLEKPVVVGHSLGGMLALWLGAEASDAVGAIVAVDGVPFLPALLQPGASVESSRGPAEAMRQGLLAATREQRLAQARMQLAGWTKGEANLEFVVAMAGTADPVATGQALMDAMTTDLRQKVAGIQAPVLLVAAGDFARTPEMRAQITAAYEAQIAAAPNHTVVLAENARHFVMLDDPDFLFATVDSFLEGKRR